MPSPQAVAISVMDGHMEMTPVGKTAPSPGPDGSNGAATSALQGNQPNSESTVPDITPGTPSFESRDDGGSPRAEASENGLVEPPDDVQVFEAQAPNGGLHAWMGVFCGAVICFWYMGVTYSWGVIQAALVEEHLAPPPTLAFVGSGAVALIAILAMVNSRLLRVIGARRTGLIGATCMGLAQILAGFSTHNLAGLFVTAGVLMGVGVSLCFMVCSITPMQYFTTKRGTAVGIVYAGGGLGGAVISLAMEAGVRHLGVAWTFRLLGILCLACCLPAAWFLKERVPPQRNAFADWSLFKSFDFVCLFIAGAVATFPLFVPPFFLPLYAQSLHFSASSGAILVCVFNFASALGRIIIGVLADRVVGTINALWISLILTAVTLLVLWPTSTSMGPLVAFVVLNGMANGAFFAIMPTVVGNVLGSGRMGVAFGMIVTSWAGGYLMGAPIAGYLLGAFGGTERGVEAFRPAVLWAGGMSFVALVAVSILRLRKSTDLKVKV